MRMRAVALLLALVLAGCAAPPPTDAGAPTPEPSPTPAPQAPTPEVTPTTTPPPPSPTPEPEPTPAPTPTPSPPPAAPTPTPSPPPTPTPTPAPAAKTFSRTVDLVVDRAGGVATTERDCLRIYSSTTAQVLGGNASVTWTDVPGTTTRLALEMRADPQWSQLTRAQGSSPVAIVIPAVQLAPIAAPDSQPPSNTVASAWFKVGTGSGGDPMVRTEVKLTVSFDYHGSGIDADVGGCRKPGID